MDLYNIKLQNNQFINQLLAYETDITIIKEIGTIVHDEKIIFVINCLPQYHILIEKIAHKTFNEENMAIWLVLNVKYNFKWEVNFVEKDFTIAEIENFTYFYFVPNTSKNRYLFKYIEIGKGLTKLLNRNTFYFNKPQNFKDYTDCKYQIDTEASEINIVNFYFKKALETDSRITLAEFKSTFIVPVKSQFNKDLMEHHYEGVFAKIGITCFSEKYDNKLMWDHYAGGSKGICLVFDTTIAGKRYYSFTKKKVKYFNKPPKYFYDATGLMEMAHIVFAKTKEYKFENEIREVINFQGLESEKRVVKFDPHALKAIIFGPNIYKIQKDNLTATLLDKAKYKDLEFIESSLDNGLKLKLAKHKTNLLEKVLATVNIMRIEESPSI